MIRAKGAKTFFQNTNNTQRWIFELKLSLPESFIRGLKVSEWYCGGWLYSLAGSVGQSDVDFNNNNSNNNNIDDEDNCCLSNPALDITSYTQPWNTFSPLFAGLISLSLSLFRFLCSEGQSFIQPVAWGKKPTKQKITFGRNFNRTTCCVILSSTVWPNVGIKCGPTSSKSCPKRRHSNFSFKSDIFIVDSVTKCWNKMWPNFFQKLPKRKPQQFLFEKWPFSKYSQNLGFLCKFKNSQIRSHCLSTKNA